VVLDDTDPQLVRVTAYFPAERWESVRRDLEAFAARLGSLFPEIPRLSFMPSPLRHENWAVAWKGHFKSVAIGNRLMVTPPWINPEPSSRHVIVIEPGEAFGTGTHETTQGCLELLEEAVEGIAHTGRGFSLLDVGCGSGILAIAGVKLGAQRVTAVDHDPVAVENARKNAALNHVEARLALICGSIEAVKEPTDIVTANLDTSTLLNFKDHLLSLCNRFLIVSGVPSDRWDHVRESLQTRGCRLQREITRSEWGCGLFVKI
jgi:ribosomal protein L11 methyltransferase